MFWSFLTLEGGAACFAYSEESRYQTNAGVVITMTVGLHEQLQGTICTSLVDSKPCSSICLCMRFEQLGCLKHRNRERAFSVGGWCYSKVACSCSPSKARARAFGGGLMPAA